MKRSAMIAVADTSETFSRWIESVAQVAASLLSRTSSPATIRFVEAEDGELNLHFVKGEIVGKVANPECSFRRQSY